MLGQGGLIAQSRSVLAVYVAARVAAVLTRSLTHLGHSLTYSLGCLRTLISLVSYWCSVLLASSRLARSSLSLIALWTSRSLRCSPSHSAWWSTVDHGGSWRNRITVGHGGTRWVMGNAWVVGGGVAVACVPARAAPPPSLSLRTLRRLELA